MKRIPTDISSKISDILQKYFSSKKMIFAGTKPFNFAINGRSYPKEYHYSGKIGSSKVTVIVREFTGNGSDSDKSKFILRKRYHVRIENKSVIINHPFNRFSKLTAFVENICKK